MTIEPDPLLPDDGFYDAFALTVLGIAPGDTLGGFSVQFDFLGLGTPGSQSFDIVDPNTFDVLASGETIPSLTPPPSVIPLPPALWLFASGLAFLGVQKRQTRTVHKNVPVC